MDYFFSSVREYVLPHWPFAMMALVYMVIGQVMTTRVFTRERAYADSRGSFARHFWYWGRETLPLHPILAGAATGALWLDPEGYGWSLTPSMGYFAGAGALSLFAWVFLKAFAKQRFEIDLALPGESMPPDENTPVERPRK